MPQTLDQYWSTTCLVLNSLLGSGLFFRLILTLKVGLRLKHLGNYVWKLSVHAKFLSTF